MAQDIDDIEAFESKKTSHDLPVGWLILFWGLILWGVFYLYTYTPSMGGWSQEKAYQESVTK
jgi:hypothetical protein